MRWLALYLRARGVPAVAVTVCGLTAAAWALGVWAAGRSGPIPLEIAVLAVGAAVAVTAPTLGGADPALDRTAAITWPRRRGAHLTAATALVGAVLAAAAATGTPLAGTAVLLRDTAGLAGAAALGAVLHGASMAWWPPVTWALVGIAVGGGAGRTAWTQLLTWPVQPAADTPATIVAATLAICGVIGYSVRGSRA